MPVLRCLKLVTFQQLDETYLVSSPAVHEEQDNRSPIMKKPIKPRPGKSGSLRQRYAELLKLREQIRKLAGSGNNPQLHHRHRRKIGCGRHALFWIRGGRFYRRSANAPRSSLSTVDQVTCDFLSHVTLVDRQPLVIPFTVSLAIEPDRCL